MTVGLKVVFPDNHYIFVSLGELNHLGNCQTLVDIVTLDETQYMGGYIRLAWRENVGCTASGSDYAFIVLGHSNGNGYYDIIVDFNDRSDGNNIKTSSSADVYVR